MKKRIAIIGSGVSGLSVAAYTVNAGHEVHVFEKNSGAGGAPGNLLQKMDIHLI